ncbi:CHAT domain-containing protein [Saccharothrix luteola]|uniref:CHAT domain-containing protein n=1 Tax=Saccharothrix luteola TaxID=2893018 RepID=UPI001E3357EC|nr:CHAT domain-containing protein [Saccharothrix luteola]MCC8247632.1 CHAT domain-containing protein [Saccharothrix luteola]
MNHTATLDLDQLRLRASLLSHYELSWIGTGTEGEALLAESTRVLVGGVRHWMLDDSVRRSVTSRATFDELRAAWSRLAYRPSDARQRAIDRVVGARAAVRPEELGTTDLRAMAWLSRWLGDHVPIGAEVHRALAHAELLEPLRALGDEHFVGREEMLSLLWAHFLRPGPPLLLHGVGGIGKSALLARHVLRIGSDGLVCYLNFDQSELDPRYPASVVAAMAHQLAAQTGENRFDRLLTGARDLLRGGDKLHETSIRSLHQGRSHDHLLRLLESGLSGERVLLVLDTFEEVQRRDREVQRSFATFLTEVAEALPRLSIVLGGRSPAPDLSLRAVQVPLLDPDEAIALLRSLLPFDLAADEAARVVDAVRPSPLCVRLAAGILRKHPADDPFREVAVRLGAIEGELYHRLLGYIDNPKVRRLAHPGLTLRRVTPDLIRTVLSVPCRVAVPDRATAQLLFDELAREAMLVDRAPGGLVHRKDVRQMMLPRLSADDPRTVADIHRRAITYYRARGGDADRTEELYHRLMLGQERTRLEQRWADAALPGLLPSFDEFPPTSKAYLATKAPGLGLSEEDLGAAEAVDRREQVLRRARHLVRDRKLDEALRLVETHRFRYGDRSFEIIDLLVQVLEHLHRYDEALAEVWDARDHSSDSGTPLEFYALTFHVIRLAELTNDLEESRDEALAALRTVDTAPDTTDFRLIRLRLVVQCLRLVRRGLDTDPFTAEGLADEAVGLYRRLSPRMIRRVPGLLRDLAGEVGERDPGLLRTAIRSIGLDPRDMPDILAAFDGEQPSSLFPSPQDDTDRYSFADRLADLADERLLSTRVAEVVAETYRQGTDDAVFGEVDSELALSHRPEPAFDAVLPADRPDVLTKAREAGAQGRHVHALRLLKRAAHSAATDTDSRALITMALAAAQAEVGDIAAAVEFASRANELAAGGPNAALVEAQYAMVLHRVDRSAAALDHYDNALSLMRRSVAITDTAVASTTLDRGLARLAVGDVEGAVTDFTVVAGVPGRPELRARALANLGNAARLGGDLPAALAWHERAERVLRDARIAVFPDSRLDFAEALLDAGLADEAAMRLRDVLMHLRMAKLGIDVAVAEQRLAVAELLLGDYAQAGVHAAAARRRFTRRGAQHWATLARLTELRIHLARDRSTAAIQHRAVELADELASQGLPDEAGVARLLAARVAIRRRALAEAEELIRAVPPPGWQAPVDCRVLWRLCRAELAVASGKRARALNEVRHGYAEVSGRPERLGTLDLPTGTVVHWPELAQLGVDITAEHTDTALFDSLERAKSPIHHHGPAPTSEEVVRARTLSRLRQQRRFEGRRVEGLGVRGNRVPRDAWTRHARPAPLSAVTGRLGDRALVGYGVTRDSLVAIVAVGALVRSVRLGSAERAAENARMLTADLNALAPDHLPPALISVLSASARKRADQLDTQLIRPLADLIGERELVVVPTGALHAVPWGVLPTLHGRPVVVAPSATAWLAADRAESSPAGPTVLLRGPGMPAYAGEIDHLRGYYRTATSVTGDRATVAAALDAFDGAGIVHVAARGVHEPTSPLFSHLELVDGPLFAHQLTGLTTPPRHVVLAAYAPDLGRIHRGDDPLGFAGALLAGGTRTVVAPLCGVGDQVCAATMADYHRNLAAGARPVEALADAVAVAPLRRPFVCLGSGQS